MYGIFTYILWGLELFVFFGGRQEVEWSLLMEGYVKKIEVQLICLKWFSLPRPGNGKFTKVTIKTWDGINLKNVGL